MCSFCWCARFDGFARSGQPRRSTENFGKIARGTETFHMYRCLKYRESYRRLECSGEVSASAREVWQCAGMLTISGKGGFKTCISRVANSPTRRCAACNKLCQLKGFREVTLFVALLKGFGREASPKWGLLTSGSRGVLSRLGPLGVRCQAGCRLR